MAIWAGYCFSGAKVLFYGFSWCTSSFKYQCNKVKS